MFAVRLCTRGVRLSQLRFGSSLVLAEHDNKALKPATLKAITAASKFGDVSVLVVGTSVDTVANAVSKAKGVKNVFTASGDQFKGFVSENISPVLLELQKANNFSHIVAPSTAFGKSVLPRVAAKLDAAVLSDVTEVKDENTFVRTMYAGNAVATVKSSDKVKVLTVRIASFDAAPLDGTPATITPAPAANTPSLSKWVSETIVKSERPELTEAQRIVSGGRGMKGPEHFELLYKLADKIGAAVGASRAAVDAGWVPNDMQIGQTGKNVAPELYLGVGISGALQHLAGMKDSKVIVVINKDPEAPFFECADYGLVADLFQAVPELTGKL